jgi:hypothetical protein
MLVMAIEGAKQLADPNRTILGFKIKDAFFLGTLDTSFAFEGIETQLHIKSDKSGMDKDDAWSEFKLYTLVNEDWLENCHGSIQVEYEQPAAELNASQEKEGIILHYEDMFKKATEQYIPVEKTYMYRRMDEFGYNYGPSFRPLQEILCSNTGEAIAQVKVFDWSLEEHFQPHVIHPTTFDGILQLIFTALTRGGVDDLPTIIPTHIHRLWLSNSELSASPPGIDTPSLKVHVKSKFKGFRSSQSSLVVLAANGKLGMKVDAIATTLVANLSALQESSGERQRCYNIDWKPDLRMLEPKQVMKYCESEDGSKKNQVQFYNNLTLVLLLFVNKALDAISNKEPENPTPYLTRYIGWMKKQLANFNTGLIPDANPECDLAAQSDSEQLEQLCGHLELNSRQGKLFITTGRNLLKILYGELDPLSFLFEDDLVKGYYHDIFDSVQCIPQLQKYLDALVHQNPAIKILEIGAGTGGMTGHLLKILVQQNWGSETAAARYSHYDYTDISPSFFEEAQERFKAQAGRMNFKMLNIDDDPILQGFEEHQYDVLVASSVSIIQKKAAKY